MKNIWKLSEVVVVPAVIGALGVTPNRLKDWIKKLNVRSSIELLLKAPLLRTEKIVKYVSET